MLSCTSPWLLAALLSKLSAADSCGGVPAPQDQDFVEGGEETLGRKFIRCAAALDDAGGHRSILPSTLVFRRPPDLSSPSSHGRPACSFGLHLKEVLLHPFYLIGTRSREMAASQDMNQLVHVGACVPMACTETFADLALPRLMEWRGKGSHHPGAGPCMALINSETVETFENLEDKCRHHLHFHFFLSDCYAVVDLWRLMSDSTFYKELFGAQVRSLPMDWPGGTQPGAAQVALWHYRKCKAGHGMYIGVYFNAIAEDAVGYELGMCLPSMSTHWHLAREQLVRWWLAFQMGTLHPELEIDAGSLKIAELAHRSEVPVDWAIIGLGRSGTSSLAAWLDTHPQLELFRDKTDSFNEGAFHYLFRRTNLEHLVRRDSLSQNPAKTGRRKRRILAGFKEPHLLQQERGRLILAEMQHVKLLVIVKNWADWLKSHVLFAGATNCFPRTLAELPDDSEATSCGFSFESGHVVPKMQDLESKGVAVYQMKLVHLDTLMEEGEAALQRIAAFLGARAGAANRSFQERAAAVPLPQQGNVSTNEAAFWKEWCELPQDMALKLERRREAATAGLAEILLRSLEPVPASLLRPEPLKDYACKRALDRKAR
ncbi:unnamed protein product [Symbiodinium microadriaticum]|nr:unnamed protein product [Symbiodinium microadriaticum]